MLRFVKKYLAGTQLEAADVEAISRRVRYLYLDNATLTELAAAAHTCSGEAPCSSSKSCGSSGSADSAGTSASSSGGASASGSGGGGACALPRELLLEGAIARLAYMDRSDLPLGQLRPPPRPSYCCNMAYQLPGGRAPAECGMPPSRCRRDGSAVQIPCLITAWHSLCIPRPQAMPLTHAAHPHLPPASRFLFNRRPLLLPWCARWTAGGCPYLDLPLEEAWEQLIPDIKVYVSGVSEGCPRNLLSAAPDAYFETNDSADNPPWVEVRAATSRMRRSNVFVAPCSPRPPNLHQPAWTFFTGPGRRQHRQGCSALPGPATVSPASKTHPPPCLCRPLHCSWCCPPTCA